MRRIIKFAMAILVGTFSTLSYPATTSAFWQHDCEYPPTYSFVDDGGVIETHLWLKAARAKVEETTSTTPVLCQNNTGQSSYSKFYVDLTYAASDGWDVYRVGETDCAYHGCPPLNNPFSDSGYFFAYGRASGYACGAQVIAVEQLSDMNFVWGSLWYQIIQSGSNYNANVGGNTLNSRPVNDLNVCWGQVDRAEYFTEHLDKWDQYPGRAGDQQGWSDVTWTDSSSVIHSVNRPYLSLCDVIGTNGNWCRFASNKHHTWYQYDTRQP